MKFVSACIAIAFTLLLSNCSKDKAKKSHYYQYKINPSYVGSHPKADFEANLYVLDNEGLSVQYQFESKGTLATKEYLVNIYSLDTSQVYGYSAEPTISLGKMSNTNGLFLESSAINYDAFLQDFKGYLVINDPDNISRDTSSLLVFGKIGSEW